MKKSEKGGSNPIIEKSWKVTTSPPCRRSTPERIFSAWPPKNSAASALQSRTTFSLDANVLEENKACTTLTGGPGAARAEAAIAFSAAMDCFTFLATPLPRLGAMSGKAGGEQVHDGGRNKEGDAQRKKEG